jgi:5-methylcytosine-specific restriction endonuclease McrA
MKKQEMIAKHGQAYYEAHLAKRAAYMNKWYHKNAEKVIESQSAALKRKMDAMSPEELAEFRALKVTRSATSREKKREYYLEVGRKGQNARNAAKSPEQRKAEAAATYQRKIAKAKATEETYQEWRKQQVERHFKWREANREHVNEYSRKRLEIPEVREKARVYSLANRHERRKVGKIDRHYVLWIRTQACVDCGSREKIEVGHIIPVAEGGDNSNENLIPQCRSCNRRLWRRRHKSAKETIP